MKALLICPSKRPAIPHLSESGPLATIPILGESLIGHWIEHLVSLGATQIRVVTVDEKEHVAASVGNGARWGVSISIASSSGQPTRMEAAKEFRPKDESDWLPEPHDVVVMSHLPGFSELPLFESYATWYVALSAWMPRALTPTRVRVVEKQPGIWVGSRARVSQKAKLVSPCWVGDQVAVGPGAVIGPGSILEDRSVVGAKATVRESWIGPDTCVGPMTSVASSLAWGSRLIDWRNDSSLQVPDPFLLGSLVAPAFAATKDRFGRPLGAPEPSRAQNPLIAAMHTPLAQSSNLKPSG
jgi:NDP-sugar pyrophosphorylase family protein